MNFFATFSINSSWKSFKLNPRINVLSWLAKSIFGQNLIIINIMIIQELYCSLPTALSLFKWSRIHISFKHNDIRPLNIAVSYCKRTAYFSYHVKCIEYQLILYITFDISLITNLNQRY